MQRVGLQRLARGLGRNPIERTRACKIDRDRDDDHCECPECGLDDMAVAAGQARRRLPDHHAREHE